jgi:hypothetical protein
MLNARSRRSQEEFHVHVAVILPAGLPSFWAMCPTLFDAIYSPGALLFFRDGCR